ncbi:hypothetical protein RO07_18825 [Pandoraea pulmonicola]|uniref:Transposase n=1 Tax=Pandoraea pulmonicola TaxID=93221 RepID=A0ABM5S2P0_PANPU|nr:hypothetical protein RO07_18825 [Pandoraea pulmonicola]
MSGSAESESRHFTGIPVAERVFFYALRTLVLRSIGRLMDAMRTTMRQWQAKRGRSGDENPRPAKVRAVVRSSERVDFAECVSGTGCVQ